MIIKKPSDCSKQELGNFKMIVLSGGQVKVAGLEKRIFKCKYLGFYYEDNELIGVSAIKQKKPESVKRTHGKAKIISDQIPLLELGYSVTKSEHRGKGINRKINDALLKMIDAEKIYATTDNNIMRKYLTEKGFKKMGESFKGEFNMALDYFEK